MIPDAPSIVPVGEAPVVAAALAEERDEDRFRLLGEAMPGICWLADAAGRPYWINRAGQQHYGEGLLDDGSPADLVHPDDLARIAAEWERARGRGEPGEASVRTRGVDGVYRPFLTRIAPVRDGRGTLVRWCGVQVDLTERHAHDRRQAFLRAFHDAARDLTEPAAIMAALATMLFDQLSVNRMVHAEALGGDERRFGIFRARADGTSAVGAVTLGPAFDALIAAARAGRTLVVTDEDRAPSALSKALAAQGAPVDVRAGIHVPIVRDGRVAGCLSVLSERARRWTADEVELCEELAERAWTATERVRAEGRLKERERHQRFLIDWGDSLRRTSDPDEIMQGTLERLGQHLAVTRTTYSEADDERRVFTTCWDWCDGCPSLVGTRVAMAAIAPEIEREWLAGHLVRYDDVGTDPRVVAADRAVYAERHIAAFVSIPLIRDRRVRSILSVQSRSPRAWLPSELDLIRDMGERTWVALERARAQAELKERERTQAFMIAWGDRVRAETRADVILDATLERLGEHLGANRAVWSQLAIDGGHYTVCNEWRRGVGETLGLSWPASNLSDVVRETYLAGEPLVSDDLRSDHRFSGRARDAFLKHEVVSRIGVPLARRGVVQAILAVDCREPRRWTRAEVQLLREIADRVWALLQRARSEERLAESEALLAAFMEHAPLGMSLKDADGRYLRLNPELSRQIGVPAGAAVGRLPEDILSAGSAHRMAKLGASARGGTVASVEFEFPDRADYAALLAVEFPIGGGGAARTGGFTLDLTARKAAEAELARSREALYQTEKLSALGSLLAGVSHELNNPLSIVVAQAVMLERHGQGTELAERAFKIRKAADRCARIVQTFLAMARQKEPERQAVDLNHVAAAALELAGYGLRSDGIAVVERFAPDLPPIAADADQLHQIIVNLVVNAHHAMTGEGTGIDGARVLTVTTARGPEPHTVALDVADTGPGISDDMARRIFEPFFTTKPQGEGTGVGLSFSLGLAEAHGGRLALVPSGSGACFRLTLPIDAEVALPRLGPEPAPPAPAGTRRALLVDDEAEIAEALGDFLGLEGYRATVVTSGAAACEAMGAEDWDLVVSDLRMPGMDGPQLHGWVLSHRPDLAERMGFVTGDTLGLSVAQFLEDTRRPVLEKPFTPEAVQRFLGQFDTDLDQRITG